MTAIHETVAEKVNECKELCNVSSIAAKLDISVNSVKQFFPLESNDSVVTGESNGNFVVQLRRANQEQKQLISSSIVIWSSHGYQKRSENLSTVEHNNQYLALLSDRQSPLISSEPSLRSVNQNVSDFKTEKKTSTDEFFNGKPAAKSEVAAKKLPAKQGITSMFQKKAKTNGSTEAKTENKQNEPVKKETTSPIRQSETIKVETENRTDQQNGTTGKKEQQSGKSTKSESSETEPSKNDSIRKPNSEKTESPKSRTVKKPNSEKTESSKNHSVKKPNSEKTDVSTPSEESGKKGSKTTETAEQVKSRKSTTENKRKRAEQTSDDEEVTRQPRSKAKKMKRVAILDSDSDDNAKGETAEDDNMDTSESPASKTPKDTTQDRKLSKNRPKNGSTKASPAQGSTKQKASPPQGSTKQKGSPPQGSTKQKASPSQASTKKKSEKINSTQKEEPESEKPSDDENHNRQTNQRRRRRVLKEVSHTCKTEDGFLETKYVKEMVSETDSEPETEAASKTKSTNKAKSVALTPAPKGQASLLSFFKKQ